MTKPEISASTLKGDVRDFLLTWIQSMDTPFHKMSERSQKDVIWAAEAQAHNVISAITMAIASRGFEQAFIRIANFGVKDAIDAKVTADTTPTTMLNFLAFKGKAAVLVFADPAVYAAERRPAKYFPDEPDMFTGDADDLPPDDGGAGGGEAKELPKETRPRRRHGQRPRGDTSQPGGPPLELPPARINQAFLGTTAPEDPIEGDLWRDGAGSIWGFKGGKWVNPKGEERPADPPAAATAEGPQKDSRSIAEPSASRDRKAFVGVVTDLPIEGDTFTRVVDGREETTYTYVQNAGEWVWMEMTTGEVYTPAAPEPAAEEPKTEPKPAAAPKTKKIDKPAAAGSADYKDPVTGKTFKDPGEPKEVTEDSGQPVITKSTGEPKVDEDNE